MSRVLSAEVRGGTDQGTLIFCDNNILTDVRSLPGPDPDADEQVLQAQGAVQAAADTREVLGCRHPRGGIQFF